MAVLLLAVCALFMLLIARFIRRRRRILAGLPVHGHVRVPAWVRRRFTRASTGAHMRGTRSRSHS